MKIEYDKSLYIKIANLQLNEIVQVKNRKGVRSTVHIQNITKLSWHELQLLMPEGEDRFSKMVLLYNRYSYIDQPYLPVFRGTNLTSLEVHEINEYLNIYRNNSFSKHFEVNHYISQNNLWDNFPTIRSLNDHGPHRDILGIQPKYFEIIRHLLGISGEGGLPLDAYQTY